MRTWLLLLLVAAPAVARAHDVRPVSVHVVEHEEGFELRVWVAPDVPRPIVALEPCAREGALWRCEGDPTLRVSWDEAAPAASLLVRIERRDGTEASIVAAPGDTRVSLPPPTEEGAVWAEYAVSGAKHFAEGPDHWFFVALLVLVAGTSRKVVLAVTGFTLGHAITLAAASLGGLKVSVPAVEGCIALSIAWLAAELVRARRETLIFRAPTLVAIAFGTLHGLGFAAVLREEGLPPGHVVSALFAFHVGIELAQLVFVAPVALVVGAAKRWSLHERARLAWVYGTGCLAAYWVIARVVVAI
ncbi:MAG: HupE/UreJ family protein [Sandaracinus sp.]|nr:HupE/UreJ family protein [Sandaracinus sp.]MCB9617887.1 HupE/UreJ family protein [Sandaracinus sp.]